MGENSKGLVREFWVGGFHFILSFIEQQALNTRQNTVSETMELVTNIDRFQHRCMPTLRLNNVYTQFPISNPRVEHREQ